MRTPLRFERSTRDDRAADFVARGAGYAVLLSGGDATVVLKAQAESTPDVITMRLVGRRADAHATGQSRLPVRSNHFMGNDPRKWKTGVPSYGRVAYENVYPGVDLVYYGNQRQLEYDFVVQPGVSPSIVALSIEGAQNVAIDADGDLVLTTKAGTLTHRAPILYQDTRGTRRSIAGAYVVRPDGTVGFRVGEYDERLPLTIDPILSYSSYLGGAAQERIHGIATDPGGALIVVGETYSEDFPTTGNAIQPSRLGWGDAFVAKLSPSGDALVYATYFGGSASESATAVDVDGAGAAYIVGETSSWNFPTRNAVQAEIRGASDSFVVKLDASGELVYSTLVGGSSEDYGKGIAVDGAGRAHIAGSTWSGDFPVVGGLQHSLAGAPVLRTTDGGEMWLGQHTGIRTRGITALALDPSNPDLIYAGTLSEGLFKTTDGGATWTPTSADFGAFEVYALALGHGSPAALYAATSYGLLRSHDGAESWNVLRTPGWVNTLAVAPGAPSTIYAGSEYSSGVMKSTDDGETWIQTGAAEGVVSLAVSDSTVYAATPGAVFTSTGDSGWVQTNPGDGSQINTVTTVPGNASLAYVGTMAGLFKTTTGGAVWEPVQALAGVPIGKVAVAPSDPSTLFALVQSGGALVSNDAGETWRITHSENVQALAIAVHPHTATTAFMGTLLQSDGFVATLSRDGSALEYSTYFGGANHDEVTDIALDGQGARYVVGTTSSPDLPVRNAVQPAFGGTWDAFAARIGPAGSLGYSTYLGGWGSEFFPRIAVDQYGQAHVVGVTWSNDYPVLSAQQPEPAGGFADVFVSVLNQTGNGFVYSTYLGGNGMDTDASRGPNVAVSQAGDTYVTGTTLSQNFPTTADALQRAYAGQGDAFLTRLDAAGVIGYSTFLGGSGNDYGQAVAVDGYGGVTVAGYTSSTNFPMHASLQPASGGSDDGFIMKFMEGSAPVDTTPPVTTLTIAGTAGDSGWYRSPITVTLTATDGESGSGVSNTQYRLNTSVMQDYVGPFVVSAQGSTRIIAQSTDLAGNVEFASQGTTVAIDSVAPKLEVASPQARDYLYDQTLTISAPASDVTSGLAGSTSISLDGAPFAGTTIDLSTLALGPHTITASVSDRAGNVSRTSVTFRVVTELDTTINVPTEAPTIQAAIDSAFDGYTVLVSPGIYRERIDFLGKAITVTSSAGATATTIDGQAAGSVVSFRSRETRASVLSGFTIRGGLGGNAGGGIYIASSSPTIRGNVITANRACTGVGVYSSFGSPLLQNNRITGNAVHGCTGGWGIGVYIGGNSSAEIIDNEITDNTGGAATGGGIALFAAGQALVQGNVIARNVTNGPGGCGYGGGVASANFSQTRILNNLIVENEACSGGGVYWGGSTGVNVFVNNTIAGNFAASWLGMYVSGFDARNELHNNIITASSGPAFHCQNGVSVSSPVLHSNDIFSPQGAAYGGTCADRTGMDGNISADPGFLDAQRGDYRVGMASPAVDSANAAAPHLPATDLSGNLRVVDGNGDGEARVDMGAFEYRNGAPHADAGPDQTVFAEADCRGTVTLRASLSDPDGDALRTTWTGAFGVAYGPALVVSLPAGSHEVTLTVDDGNGGSASDTVTITVVDRTPPTIASTTATPSILQRANHAMVPVAVTVSVADQCDGAVTCRIVSVTSNEPVQGSGGGDTAQDWEITGDLTLNLRAERSGKGTGRVYTILVACTDAAGNRATSTVTVTVPR